MPEVQLLRGAPYSAITIQFLTRTATHRLSSARPAHRATRLFWQTAQNRSCCAGAIERPLVFATTTARHARASCPVSESYSVHPASARCVTTRLCLSNRFAPRSLRVDCAPRMRCRSTLRLRERVRHVGVTYHHAHRRVAGEKTRPFGTVMCFDAIATPAVQDHDRRDLVGVGGGSRRALLPAGATPVRRSQASRPGPSAPKPSARAMKGSFALRRVFPRCCGGRCAALSSDGT